MQAGPKEPGRVRLDLRRDSEADQARRRALLAASSGEGDAERQQREQDGQTDRRGLRELGGVVLDRLERAGDRDERWPRV